MLYGDRENAEDHVWSLFVCLGDTPFYSREISWKRK